MFHCFRIVHEDSRALIAAVTCLALFSLVERAVADDALAVAVKACATIDKDAERLACYDIRVVPLTSSGVPPAALPPPSPEELFGADSSVMSTRQEAQAPEREELSEITARVTALKTLPRGESEIELDNAQVWRQVEQRELLLKVGDSVTISRAALGAFRLTTSSGRATRVTRVR